MITNKIKRLSINIQFRFDFEHLIIFLTTVKFVVFKNCALIGVDLKNLLRF